MNIIGPLLQMLSYPRRALWSGLGLPEHGNQLLGNMGFDPNATATKLLGTGLEVMGDPLGWVSAPLLESLGNSQGAMSNLNPALAGAVDDAMLAMVNGQPQPLPSQDQQENQSLPQVFQSPRLR